MHLMFFVYILHRFICHLYANVGLLVVTVDKMLFDNRLPDSVVERSYRSTDQCYEFEIRSCEKSESL